MSEQRFIGRVTTVPQGEDFGFIGLASVTDDGGKPHELETEADIFVHQDDCEATIRVGLMVVFSVVDSKKGDGRFRATGAHEHIEVGMLPATGAIVPGLENALVVPNLSPAASLYHGRMKEVPAGDVEKAVENEPLAGVPRQEPELSDDEKRQAVELFLRWLFPTMGDHGADFNFVDADDAALEAMCAGVEEDLRALNMEAQIGVLQEEVRRFKGVREALGMLWQDGLIKAGTAIPMDKLPDLFCACPVWYYWVEPNGNREIAATWGTNDPRPHEAVQYFCDLFGQQSYRWLHLFQMFNRRVRTLKDYEGDIIPPHVLRRIRRAKETFDYVVIATPYHDVAGMDWKDHEWIRAIDPYVLGFMKGLPCFFVLGRFSDSGTFPLLNELVADTMNFLEANREALAGFNEADQPYWYDGRTGNSCFRGTTRLRLGTALMSFVNEVLQAFQSGELFDWLRGKGLEPDADKAYRQENHWQ